MALLQIEWYPDGVTCLQVYKEFSNSYFGAINGVEFMDTWSTDEDTTADLLQSYYDENYGGD